MIRIRILVDGARWREPIGQDESISHTCAVGAIESVPDSEAARLIAAGAAELETPPAAAPVPEPVVMLPAEVTLEHLAAAAPKQPAKEKPSEK